MDAKLGKKLAPTIKATWSFNHVANMRSRVNLKNLYIYFHEAYGHQT